MPAFHLDITRSTRRSMTLLVAAIACIGTGGTAAAAAATSPLEFGNVAPAAPAPIALGVDLTPKLGVTGTIKFNTNGADRRALTAAKRQEQLRADAESSRAAATKATDNIAAIEQLLDQTQGDQDRLGLEISRRLSARYKSGDTGDLEFLLAGGGLGDILARNRVLASQSRTDRSMIKEFELTAGRLQDLQLVLEQLRDINGEQAERLELRADELNAQLVAARVGHSEPVDAPLGKNAGASGTWYVMDGAFQAQLYLPSAGSGYTGGTRTPRMAPTQQQIAMVLGDPRIVLTASNYSDVASGQIDGRVLGAISAAANQFGLIKITSMKRDHGVYTSSGNVSAHSVGCAVDIGTIGGTYITPGSQTPGSEVEQAVRFFMSLPGDLAPHQVISLFDFGGASLAMGDHGDHIHLGYSC